MAKNDLTFQNDLRNRLFRCVRDRQRGILNSQLGGELSGLAVKRHRRTSPWHACNLTVPPANTVIPSRAERLHRSLFGREARRITLVAICFRNAIAHFPLRINAIEEALPEALD